jgi:hypothetical protein
MKLVRQPHGSNLCGQACIATICNITLEESIMLVRTSGKTKTKHLKRALHAMSIEHGNKRIRGLPKEGSALLYWTGDAGCHWTVWHNKKHYDPAAGTFRKTPNHLSEARVTSHLPITIQAT